MTITQLAVSSVLNLTETLRVKPQSIGQEELTKLRLRAHGVLNHLVTARGIYASSALEWSGPYHAYFGRDTAITAALVLEAETWSGRYELAPRALAALFQIAKYQGKYNSEATGEELGKIPHEVRTNWKDIQELQARRHQAGEKLWHIHPVDHILKNWDSNDSTPLWLITVGRWHESGLRFDKDQLGQIRSALEWCLENIKQFGGLAGFSGIDHQPGRHYGGLNNQGWKDSAAAYLDKAGRVPIHPIHDVFINAAIWSALLYGADMFWESDRRFAAKLIRSAKTLKKRFNSAKRGFRRKDPATGLWYYAEALDGNFEQLPGVAVDPGMALWAYHGRDCIIDRRFLDNVVKRLFKPDLFNPDVGLRNYSHNITNYDRSDVYHRGPDTYWPFVSGMTMQGLERLGYHKQAKRLASALLKGLGNFESCVELFIEQPDHSLHVWQSPDSPQTSATDQAWTAAAMYYATNFLLYSAKA